MNGVEILKKYYADYDSGKTVMLSEMIDIAIAEATESGCTRSHPHEDMNSHCVLKTDIARLANNLAAKEHELAAAQQQILERDATIFAIKNSRGERFTPEPSEALRLHDEQIKKEVQEKYQSVLLIALAALSETAPCAEELCKQVQTEAVTLAIKAVKEVLNK